jgi:hypothetical protein
MDIDPEGEWGYMLTVSLDYPDILHDRDIMLPLAVTKRTNNSEQFEGQIEKNGWRKASGIPQNEKNNLTPEIYNQLLFDDQPVCINTSIIESNNHSLVSKKMKRFHFNHLTRIGIDTMEN